MEAGVGQIVIRNLEESVKARLKRRATRHGRSVEVEIRTILRNAVKADDPRAEGLGTRIARRFAGIGFKDDELAGLEGEWARLWRSNHP